MAPKVTGPPGYHALVPPPPRSSHLPAGQDLDPAQLSAQGSVTQALVAGWRAEPERPTLLDLGATTPGWCTGGELEARTAAAAAGLAAAGLGAGDRLVWSTGTSLDAVVVALGALRAGGVLVPANVAWTERELAHVVGDVRPTVAVLERPEQAAAVQAAAGGPLSVLTPTLERLAAPGAGRDAVVGAPLDRASPTDAALIVFTSGTTGRPKGAVLRHTNLVAGSASIALAWRWEPDDRLVLSLPLFHVHGLCAGLLGTLLAGASAVLLPRFEAAAVLDAAAAHRATLFFGVPTMYQRLGRAAGVDGLARLRLCVSGSAPLPAALWEEIRRRSGVAVLERYGMTETLLTYSNPVDGERRPSTVGFALPGVEGRLDAPGEDGAGELLVRGPAVFSGYWERPEADAAGFTDGWFRTGDLATFDDDGYLSLVGRRSDLVISGGHNVYPAEVEDVLLEHPGVAEAAVAGTPSEEWGETVTAWVVRADGGCEEADLVAFCAERLAPYKRPRLVHFVEALPRNAMGKVVRRELS